MTDTTFSLFRALRPLSLLALVAALGATACKTQIIGGGSTGGGAGHGFGGEGGEGGEGGVGGTPGGGGGTPGTGGYATVGGVAEWADQMNELPMGAGPNIDPDALFIKVGNYGPVCGGTFDWGCSPGIHWQVSIGLPPTMQGPGIYSLMNPAVVATSAESGGAPGQPGEPSECWAGGGQFTQGTIEVLSNDGATIAVRLSNTSSWVEFNADGDYIVPICP